MGRFRAPLTLGPDASRFLGPDASLFLGPDASRFLGPDASLFLGPDASRFLGPDASLFLGLDPSRFPRLRLSLCLGPSHVVISLVESFRLTRHGRNLLLGGHTGIYSGTHNHASRKRTEA
jgi:hypothetical protein